MKVLLTFDIEEFDVPEEFGRTVSDEEKIAVSTEGLQKLMAVIDKHDITCTFFTTAVYALAKPELIRKLSAKHEIASHGYYHSAFKNADLLESRLVLEKITGQKVFGYRMARLAPVDNAEMVKAGYEYNSSMNPTWLPGRYNNLDKPRKAFVQDQLLQVPTSVTPLLRIPLFWLAFKNFPMWWLKSALKRTLRHDGVLSLYFHPWEFTEATRNYGLPGYIAARSGQPMIDRLDEAITMLRKEYAEFVTMHHYTKSISRQS